MHTADSRPRATRGEIAYVPEHPPSNPTLSNTPLSVLPINISNRVRFPSPPLSQPQEHSATRLALSGTPRSTPPLSPATPVLYYLPQDFKNVLSGIPTGTRTKWLRILLEHALADGDHARTSELFKAGAKVSATWKGSGGRTHLIASAAGGSRAATADVIKQLGAGADLNAVCGMHERTALMWAIQRCHWEVSRFLIEQGAGVSVVDTDHRTPLHIAISRGSEEIPRLLILAGSDVYGRDSDGVIPILLTITRSFKGGPEVFSMLLQRMAKLSGVDVVDNNGRSLVQAAVECKKVEYLNALVKAGGSVNKPIVHQGKNRQVTYFSRDSPRMTRALLRLGANPNLTRNGQLGPLHSAAEAGNKHVVSALLDAGANTEAKGGIFYVSGVRNSGSAGRRAQEVGVRGRADHEGEGQYRCRRR